MEHRHTGDLEHDELASGDASRVSNELSVASSSVLSTISNATTEECSDEADSTSDGYFDANNMKKRFINQLGCKSCHCVRKENGSVAEQKVIAIKVPTQIAQPHIPVANLEKNKSTSYANPAEKTLSLDIPNFNGNGKGDSQCEMERQRIRLDDISKLFTCESCKSLPISSQTVHTCSSGHQTCGYCFDKGQRICFVCQKPVKGRNEVLEKVLIKLRRVCPDLFQQSLKRLDSELQMKLDAAKDGSRTVQQSSHKPVNCPHLFCRRRIASSGFVPHFEFEHSEVPVFQMPLKYYHLFSLPLDCDGDDFIRAVAIVRVNIVSNQCKVQRIESSLITKDKQALFSERRDSVVCVLLCSSVQINSVTFVTAWCSCLYEHKVPLTYTLKAKTETGYELSYTGPPRSLHNSQDSETILSDFQSLLLSPVTCKQLLSEDNQTICLGLRFNLTS